MRAVKLGALAVAMGIAGCDRAPSDSQSSRTESVQTLGKDGPIRATLRVSPTAITTAERIAVRLEVRLASGVELGDVDLAKSLPEGLSVVDVKSDRRAAEGGAMIVVREWSVEPFLAGEYEIGTIKVEGEQKGKASDPASRRAGTGPPMQTAPVKVVVSSVLKAGEEELAEAKPIVEAPYETPVWVWWALGGGAVCAGALAWWIAARRRRAARGPEPVYVSAHELAMRRMGELMARRLVEAGRFKEFYEEASLILRRYIEDRFGLHAPERTTEEFLDETRSSAMLMEDDVRVLRKFLGHCDMVKFAAVIPSTPEAEGVAATVREFVERTQDAGRVVQMEEVDGEAQA